jgi:hypothetical protein
MLPLFAVPSQGRLGMTNVVTIKMILKYAYFCFRVSGSNTYSIDDCPSYCPTFYCCVCVTLCRGHWPNVSPPKRLTVLQGCAHVSVILPRLTNHRLPKPQESACTTPERLTRPLQQYVIIGKWEVISIKNFVTARSQRTQSEIA